MRASLVILHATLVVVAGPAVAASADEACRKVLETRVQTCTEACVARAKAAVDPQIRDRVRGVGCANNCAKLEMFAGHDCPAP